MIYYIQSPLSSVCGLEISIHCLFGVFHQTLMQWIYIYTFIQQHQPRLMNVHPLQTLFVRQDKRIISLSDNSSKYISCGWLFSVFQIICQNTFLADDYFCTFAWYWQQFAWERDLEHFFQLNQHNHNLKQQY